MANRIIEDLLDLQKPIVFKEVESNNTLQQANSLGNLFSVSQTANGNVKIIPTPFSATQPSTIIRDPNDIYSFEVDRASVLDVRLDSNNSKDVAVRLIRDFNNDGISGSGDLLASSNQPGEDLIQFDQLDPGRYFLEVIKTPEFASVDYSLSPRVSQIAQADLTIGIERLIPLDVKTSVVVETNVNGLKQTSSAFSPTPGQSINLTSNVAPGLRELNVSLKAFRLGPKGIKVPLDIDSRAGITQLEFTYDTLTRQVKAKNGNGFFGSEDQVIRQTVRGDGEGTISGIRVSYTTEKRSTLLPGRIPVKEVVPVVRDGAAANLMQGSAQSGILLGLGGNDRANGGDGDDIIDGGSGTDTLIGGVGDDILIGGTHNDRLFGKAGDDILDGGRGADRLTGGSDSDTFVLARGNGSDIIVDFQDGQDVIGLKSGLTFADLKFVQQGNSTVILAGKEQLAIAQGVSTSAFDSNDFEFITTLPIAGAIVPILA